MDEDVVPQKRIGVQARNLPVPGDSNPACGQGFHYWNVLTTAECFLFSFSHFLLFPSGCSVRVDGLESGTRWLFVCLAPRFLSLRSHSWNSVHYLRVLIFDLEAVGLWVTAPVEGLIVCWWEGERNPNTLAERQGQRQTPMCFLPANGDSVSNLSGCLVCASFFESDQWEVSGNCAYTIPNLSQRCVTPASLKMWMIPQGYQGSRR